MTLHLPKGANGPIELWRRGTEMTGIVLDAAQETHELDLEEDMSELRAPEGVQLANKGAFRVIAKDRHEYSEPGGSRIRLHASDAITELLVIDADFRTVKRNVGSLTVDVPPGIYRIEYRSGPAAESRLVSLREGESFDADVDIAFPTAAPVSGSPTWDPTTKPPCDRVSQHLAERSR